MNPLGYVPNAMISILNNHNDIIYIPEVLVAEPIVHFGQ